jgi:hypothetical protein
MPRWCEAVLRAFYPDRFNLSKQAVRGETSHQQSGLKVPVITGVAKTGNPLKTADILARRQPSSRIQGMDRSFSSPSGINSVKFPRYSNLRYTFAGYDLYMYFCAGLLTGYAYPFPYFCKYREVNKPFYFIVKQRY